jgi:hypothetical protein
MIVYLQLVVPGLVRGIHVFLANKTWMAGTSPAMTEKCEIRAEC